MPNQKSPANGGAFFCLCFWTQQVIAEQNPHRIAAPQNRVTLALGRHFYPANLVEPNCAHLDEVQDHVRRCAQRNRYGD